MGVFLRIDVDNCYSWKNLLQKSLNYLCLNYPFIAIRSPKLGYHSFMNDLLQIINDQDIEAGWFFQPNTTPKRNILDKLKKTNQVLGYHCVSSYSFESFFKGLHSLEKKLSLKLNMFTKHGSGKLNLNRFHTPEYNESELVEFGKLSSLKLFSGNLEDPSLKSREDGDLKVFPSTYWINPRYRDTSKFDLEWLESYAKHNTVICLIHPLRLLLEEDTSQEFNKFLNSQIEILPFSDLLN